MPTIAVIGAGITGITSAYELGRAGYDVVVFDRNRYPAMETSFANGGQLSACNAEVWNNSATILKALRWLVRSDAPLRLDLKPSWHKYSWLAEFLIGIRDYEANTSATVKLAEQAKKNLFAIAEREGIDFDLERRGILHLFHDQKNFSAAKLVNELLQRAGLERWPVTPLEIAMIEPALSQNYYGGFYTPGDASGDIHKFTRGLAAICQQRGTRFVQEASVRTICNIGRKFKVVARSTLEEQKLEFDFDVDKVVVCAGVNSREIGRWFGDRINIYPVKGYSITVNLARPENQKMAPQVSLLDEAAKIVTSRLGPDRFRIAGTAELNGFNRDIRADRIEPLRAWARNNFPAMDTSNFVPWSGLRPMMPNMIPVVRRSRMRGVYYNTGHGHLGWTLSAATAEILTRMVGSESS